METIFRRRDAQAQEHPVKRLLENPAIIGTFVPHTLHHVANTGKTKRHPQEAVQRYLPRIEDE